MAYPAPTPKRSGMSAGLKMNENVQRKRFYALSEKYNKSDIKVI